MPSPYGIPPGYRISRLVRQHRREEFRCGNPALDDFIAKHARQNQDVGFSSTRILSPEADEFAVVGYYSLACQSVAPESVPTGLVKRLPRHSIPCALLGRLAVSASMQNQRLGGKLLVNAICTVAEVADSMGLAFMIVDAIDERAEAFYANFGFVNTGDGRLFMSLKQIEATLAQFKAHEVERRAAQSLTISAALDHAKRS